MAETREETISSFAYASDASLPRKRFAPRDEAIPRAYAAMAVTEMLLRDEAEQQTLNEPARVRPVPRSLVYRGQALVKGVEVDLDAPLPDDEEGTGRTPKPADPSVRD